MTNKYERQVHAFASPSVNNTVGAKLYLMNVSLCNLLLCNLATGEAENEGGKPPSGMRAEG